MEKNSTKVEVLVETKSPYKIIIGQGLLDELGDCIRHLKLKKIALVTDVNVWSIYSDRVRFSLEEGKVQYEVLIFEAGEHTKSMENYQKGIDFLSTNYFRRDDALVAFGGGVIGDIGGFMAATYQRGMTFIQVPTTLLAGVDSSVGGKTGINLSQGKNLLGAFKQPRKVICDWSLYETMEEERFLDGVAEIIKYGILSDRKLFQEMKKPLSIKDSRLPDIIKRCVSCKADIVSKDEEEKGERKLLNLGHTIGHSIERWRDYEITHGYAVAIGLCYIAKLSYGLGLISSIEAKEIVNCVRINNLPTDTDCDLENLFRNTTIDKKCADDRITIILIKGIGDCILKTVTLSQWKEYISLALEVNLD